MHFPRASGVLLHITSLPSEFGIGDLGPTAYRFVDFLQQAGQRIWQFLPLGPTVRGNSPYSCYSAFAGNPLLISPTELVRDGLLSEAECRQLTPTSHAADRVNYLDATEFKWQLLATAFERFRAHPARETVDRLQAFCAAQHGWLDDFVLFAALMKHFGTDQWDRWDPALVARDATALAHWRQRFSKQIEFEQFVQYLFFWQWHRLKEYANSRQVRLFGDMPIFVAHGSADVWAHQQLFWLDAAGLPLFVAGVPPDYFSKTGQLWGNPLYRWDALATTKYAWWTQRFQTAFELYDLLRIDHFRGFEAYWEIPASAKTAISGRWAPGPGAAPFEAAQRQLGELPIVAEDLGLITAAVHKLRDRLNFPGMRILQFGFDQEDDRYHRPESYPENSVAYTGTHDNSTIVSWYRGREAHHQPKSDILQRYLQPAGSASVAQAVKAPAIHWQLISMVLASASHTAIIPMQDILGLDNTARMNTPGIAEGNWGWRVSADQLTDALSAQMRSLSQETQRIG